jgi:polyhydroxyalkanoate synthesis regulator protein
MVPAIEMPEPAPQTRQLLIKWCVRSRLFDAANRRYVSLEQLRDWAAEGVAFVVQDTEAGEDLTRVLLGRTKAEPTPGEGVG